MFPDDTSFRLEECFSRCVSPSGSLRPQTQPDWLIDWLINVDLISQHRYFTSLTLLTSQEQLVHCESITHFLQSCDYWRCGLEPGESSVVTCGHMIRMVPPPHSSVRTCCVLIGSLTLVRFTFRTTRLLQHYWLTDASLWTNFIYIQFLSQRMSVTSLMMSQPHWWCHNHECDLSTVHHVLCWSQLWNTDTENIYIHFI